MKKKVVIVTGAAGYWGGHTAARLAKIPDIRVIGIDSKPPANGVVGVDFVQADIREDLLKDLIELESVNTVVHLAFREQVRHSESNFENNVMGTMKFFGLCSQAGVKKIIVKSSTMVYGANITNSMFLTEKAPLLPSRNYGYTRHWGEIEAFCNGFIRQSPGISITILRFPGIIGPTVDSPLTRFLRSVWAPHLWGFNPMMQVIHEEDVLAALEHSVLHEKAGVFNIAAEGVLPLKKVTRLAGKVPVPIFHPLAYLGASSAGSMLAPIPLDFIRYPWVADLEKMRSEFLFEPHYSAEEAVREFGRMRRSRSDGSNSVNQRQDTELLQYEIERRRRALQRQEKDNEG